MASFLISVSSSAIVGSSISSLALQRRPQVAIPPTQKPTARSQKFGFVPQNACCSSIGLVLHTTQLRPLVRFSPTVYKPSRLNPLWGADTPRECGWLRSVFLPALLELPFPAALPTRSLSPVGRKIEREVHLASFRIFDVPLLIPARILGICLASPSLHFADFFPAYSASRPPARTIRTERSEPLRVAFAGNSDADREGNRPTRRTPHTRASGKTRVPEN